ncbi:hypothetical protein GCM10010123_25740 [Pilimelia anulata]|uniref:Uncharacterized protein n=1 Tax=Pilimelia anulata TaxID=53371 RepID=A0A8J3BBM0_9ACTN|nr:hypothetical protein [Pilimelia anulata]GGJ94766.1 hypothetical protein GCM10010123_25740 [Pilimelia anulata]
MNNSHRIAKIGALTLAAVLSAGAGGTAAAAAPPSSNIVTISASADSRGSAVDRGPTSSNRGTHSGDTERNARIPKWLKDLIKKLPELPAKVKAGWNTFKAWYDGLPTWAKIAISAISPFGTLYQIWEILYDLLT